MIDKMKKLIKRLSKRLYIRWLQWNRNGRSEKERKIADTEKICMSICRNLITNPNSKFLLAPVSGKRYIKNSDLELFVILDDRNISITNHVYHYDVKLEDRNWFRLINMYDLKVEAIRMEYEQDIMSQIENSLYKIQEKVRGVENISKLTEKTTDK